MHAQIETKLVRAMHGHRRQTAGNAWAGCFVPILSRHEPSHAGMSRRTQLPRWPLRMHLWRLPLWLFGWQPADEAVTRRGWRGSMTGMGAKLIASNAGRLAFVTADPERHAKCIAIFEQAGERLAAQADETRHR